MPQNDPVQYVDATANPYAVETVKVTRKGATVEINKSDFDPKTDKLVPEKGAEKATEKTVEKASDKPHHHGA